MLTRKPVVADQFYPSQFERCIYEIESCLKEGLVEGDMPQNLMGGIVPHAGWVFSGSLAAMVFSALKKQYDDVDVFIVLGAAHSCFEKKAVVSTENCWETPLGVINVDQHLTKSLLEIGIVSDNNSAHSMEHSIEVQIPFIQYMFPKARVCPIIVPPLSRVIDLGNLLASIIKKESRTILCIGSTDLTHYGPRYGFTPKGNGEQGLKWAEQINDRRFVDLAINLDPEGMLKEAEENYNACGPGAAATVVAIAKKLGKTKGLLLGMTNSNQVMLEKMGTSNLDSVGYAALIF